MDSFLRRATPAVLLILAGLAWFGPLLPGFEGLSESFGENALLRFVTGVLCVYMVMLVVERHRMDQSFRQVLSAFREFHGQRDGARKGDEHAQREAVEILIGALGSPDAEVRSSSAAHLRRLTGQDLGEDPSAWREWLAAQASPERTG